mmetsp:Transcript_74168/g.154697  ORF Transcript_74168/g.154697 Transcript_74168/m.154697 type:complete len:201 (-) Transcript_74168:81-683(-)
MSSPPPASCHFLRTTFAKDSSPSKNCRYLPASTDGKILFRAPPRRPSSWASSAIAQACSSKASTAALGVRLAKCRAASCRCFSLCCCCCWCCCCCGCCSCLSSARCCTPERCDWGDRRSCPKVRRAGLTGRCAHSELGRAWAACAAAAWACWASWVSWASGPFVALVGGTEGWIPTRVSVSATSSVFIRRSRGESVRREG